MYFAKLTKDKKKEMIEDAKMFLLGLTPKEVCKLFGTQPLHCLGKQRLAGSSYILWVQQGEVKGVPVIAHFHAVEVSGLDLSDSEKEQCIGYLAVEDTNIDIDLEVVWERRNKRV